MTAEAPEAADWPPELRDLVVDEAAGALADLARSEGRVLVTWHPRQVTHRVGRSTAVQYRVGLRDADGTATTATYVLARGLVDGEPLTAWRVPGDPLLPALAAALDPIAAERTLDRLGHPLGPVTVVRRAYRPGRRAVVEARGAAGRVFLKVVRPDAVARLAGVHRRLATTLPVPRCLAHTDDGLLVLAALPGHTMREALRTHGAGVHELPDLGAIEVLLDRIPADVTEGRRPRDPRRTLGRHVALLETVLPGEADRLRSIVGRVGAGMRHDHPLVPVHGDLYESQVLVRHGSPVVCGLLDLDTVGPGRRIDDLANLIGHLSVLTLRDHPGRLGPDAPPGTSLEHYLRAVLEAAEVDQHPFDLRARVAGRVVGLATGPFRVQGPGWPAATSRRLDLAEAWLDSV